MIARDSLVEIGRFNKPHGIKGELAATLDVDPEDLRCIFVEIEGLYVPFFIEHSRTKGAETYLLTIRGIANENDCAMLSNKPIWAEAADIESEDDDADGFYMSDLIGFTIVADNRIVGVIEDFDDSTENVLFIVEAHGSGDTIYIPAAEEMIADINTETKTITMDLPEGLLNL